MKTSSLVEFAAHLDDVPAEGSGALALLSELVGSLIKLDSLSAEHRRKLQSLASALRYQATSQTRLASTLSRVLADVLFRPGGEEDLVPNTPVNARAKILDAVRLLATDAGHIIDSPKQLKANLAVDKHALYELYRTLQAASAKAMDASRTGSNENGCTLALVQELERLSRLAASAGVAPALTVIPHLFMTSLNTGTVETDVGADFALVVAGAALLGTPGARVFWVQAKRALGPHFALSVSRKSSASCMFRQVSSLVAMDSLGEQSIAMHLQFGRGVDCLDAAWSSRTVAVTLPGKVHVSAHCKCQGPVADNRCTAHSKLLEEWDISKQTCRFAEHVLQHVARVGTVFSSEADFQEFFASRPLATHVNVPQHLVALCPTNDTAALKLAEDIVWTLYDKPSWRAAPTRGARP